MGQEEIYNILKEINKPLISREIAELIKTSQANALHIINAMLGHEIKARTLTKEEKKEMIKKYPNLKHCKSVRVYMLVR